jgi:hypothetical protein
MILPLVEGRQPHAVFAGPYRYYLAWPTPLENDRVLLGIGANPSKAGRVEGGRILCDPTISRLRNLAEELDYGWLWMVNARSYVSTDPNDVPADPIGIGPDTDTWIYTCAAMSSLVVCCYGRLAGERGSHVLELVREAGKVPHALALTKEGIPRHPRGLSASARPFPLTGVV